MTQHLRKSDVNRRHFLRSAALAGSGMVLAAPGRTRAAEARSGELQLALLGAGTQGTNLMNVCVKIAGVRFRAVCDIWTAFSVAKISNLLKVHGHEHNTYVDYREMLDKEKSLDAVLIATPDFCHADQAVACLKAGLHVYCEAPMSNTLDGARAMVQAARDTGKRLQIGQQRRSHPRYRHCGEKLLGEVRLLGRLAAANAQWNRPVQPDRGWPRRAPVEEAVLKQCGYESMEQFRNWRWHKGLGSGPVAELGAHQLDVFNWFLGTPPASVLASAGTDYYDPKTHQWPDTAMAVFEYETPKGLVRASYQIVNANSNYGSFEKFLGEHGTLVVSETAGIADLFTEPKAPDWDRWVLLDYLAKAGKKKEEIDLAQIGVVESIGAPQYTLPFKFDEPEHKPHLENFFAAARGEADLNCPSDAGYRALVAAQAISQAAETGQKVSLKPEEFVA